MNKHRVGWAWFLGAALIAGSAWAQGVEEDLLAICEDQARKAQVADEEFDAFVDACLERLEREREGARPAQEEMEDGNEPMSDPAGR